MKIEGMSKEQFKEKLCQESNSQGIELNEKQLEQLYMYKELLVEWNEKMNLTAITDDMGVILKHFVDCLECTKVIKDEESFIDVGTGAGFPGMVLAIYYPNKKFTLLDALNKRLIFLQEVIDKLEIKNVEIIHGRAEETIRINNLYNSYDASVSRAVAQLPTLLEYTSPYVKVGGKCIVMKGDNVEEEITLSQNALKILNLKIEGKTEYNYIVDGEEYNRTILSIKKINNTPSKYPRNYGQIKKKPL